MLGLDRYYTGKPCILRGHICERYTPSGHCVECQREYKRRHYAKNGEELRAAQKRYYTEHREECIESAKHWRAENPEKDRAINRAHCKRYYAKNIEKERERGRRKLKLTVTN